MNTIEMNAETLKMLVVAINTGKGLTEEQFEQAKKVAFAAMQKVLNGEPFTGDEVTVNSYIAKTMQQAKGKAEADAERKAKLQKAEAEYKGLLNIHGQTVNKLFAEWVAGLGKQFLNTKGEPKKDLGLVFTDTDAVKEAFKTFAATLPTTPKKPTTGSTGTGAKRTGTGTGTSPVWNRTADVTKLRDGSTLKVLWTALQEAGEAGLTKEAMETLMIDKFPARQLKDNKFSVYEAVSGRLPVEKHVNGDLVTFTAKVAETVEKAPETGKENKTEAPANKGTEEAPAKVVELEVEK